MSHDLQYKMYKNYWAKESGRQIPFPEVQDEKFQKKAAEFFQDIPKTLRLIDVRSRNKLPIIIAISATILVVAGILVAL